MTVDLRASGRHLGMLGFILTGAILVVAAFAAVDLARGVEAERAALSALLIAAGVCAVTALTLVLVGLRGTHRFGQREALLLVVAAWLVGAAMSALPYRLWAVMRPDAGLTPHDFDTFVNCYFEAMSGLTTTGATVLQSIGTVPRSLLLWRGVTHWLGGLGIVVLFVAVLPLLGIGGRRVYRIEATGPTPEGVTPRIQDAARILWMIYVALTVTEVVVLRVCGMGWLDATCHTFATLATGGFSTQDASIAAYPSTAVHVVVIVFMVIAGVNFGLYYQLLQRRWRSVVADTELRAYLLVILVGTAIVGVSLWHTRTAAVTASGDHASAALVARDAAFQVVSIQTTTGFCTDDFDAWGFAAKATLVLLMFVGASTGSTGGGIKVFRVVLAVKVILAEIEHVFRPQVVRTLKLGNKTINPDLKLNTLAFVMGIGGLFTAGTVGLMLFESSRGIDITTAATAAAATLNNIGPGLAKVGATHNYAWFTASSKSLMCVLMLLGRLEVYPILVLMLPRFWRSE